MFNPISILLKWRDQVSMNNLKADATPMRSRNYVLIPCNAEEIHFSILLVTDIRKTTERLSFEKKNKRHIKNTLFTDVMVIRCKSPLLDDPDVCVPSCGLLKPKSQLKSSNHRRSQSDPVNSRSKATSTCAADPLDLLFLREASIPLLP